MKQAINGNSVRRNNFISYSAIGISGLIIPSLFSCGQKKAEENVQQKPNIIVIIADDPDGMISDITTLASKHQILTV